MVWKLEEPPNVTPLLPFPFPPPLLPDPVVGLLLDAVVGEDEPEPVESEGVLLERKGFASEAIDACERSTWASTLLFPECWRIVADVDVESMADPVLQAAIQGESEDDLSESSVHDVHRTFATIIPFAIPVPSNNSNPACSVLSAFGSTCPVPFLPLSVIFPFPSAYITKMLAPAIWLPMPRATHW